jgi:ketosteroid isomerase-like protein
MQTTALATARAYHDAWTRREFDRAVALLAPTLAVEVPINEYATVEAFAAALRGFGSLARSVELIAETAGRGDDAMLLYDMDVDGLGELRVAEHFTVSDGKITRLRQIHDTAVLRAAGFAGDDGKLGGEPEKTAVR